MMWQDKWLSNMEITSLGWWDIRSTFHPLEDVTGYTLVHTPPKTFTFYCYWWGGGRSKIQVGRKPRLWTIYSFRAFKQSHRTSHVFCNCWLCWLLGSLSINLPHGKRLSRHWAGLRFTHFEVVLNGCNLRQGGITPPKFAFISTVRFCRRCENPASQGRVGCPWKFHQFWDRVSKINCLSWSSFTILWWASSRHSQLLRISWSNRCGSKKKENGRNNARKVGLNEKNSEKKWMTSIFGAFLIEICPDCEVKEAWNPRILKLQGSFPINFLTTSWHTNTADFFTNHTV